MRKVSGIVRRYKWPLVAVAVVALVVLVVVLVVPRRREGLVAAARCGTGKVWDARQNKCVCAGGSEWDSAARRCVTCGPGMEWSWSKKPRAGCACKPGTTWNGKWCERPKMKGLKCLTRDPESTTTPICDTLCTNGSDLKPVAGGFSKSNVLATYHMYDPRYETSSLQCSDYLWSQPNYGSKLVRWPWTAFCVNGLSPRESGLCGKCFRVTNRETKASIIVRAIDHGGGNCTPTSGGLDMEECAFHLIDTNGQGHDKGHMYVDVVQVDCGPGANYG